MFVHPGNFAFIESSKSLNIFLLHLLSKFCNFVAQFGDHCFILFCFIIQKLKIWKKCNKYKAILKRLGIARHIKKNLRTLYVKTSYWKDKDIGCFLSDLKCLDSYSGIWHQAYQNLFSLAWIRMTYIEISQKEYFLKWGKVFLILLNFWNIFLNK